MALDLLSLLTPLRRGQVETDAWTGDPALAPEVLPSLDAVRPETLRRLGVLPDGSAVYIVLGWLRTSLASSAGPPPDGPHVVLLRVTPSGDGVDAGRAIDARGVLANQLIAKEPLGRRRIRYVGVVPDGVAEVVISAGGHSEAFRPTGNLWFAELPRTAARRATFVWLDADGRVTARFGTPKRRASSWRRS